MVKDLWVMDLTLYQIRKEYGSYNNAIVAAGLEPNLIKTTSIDVTCIECGKVTRRAMAEVKKSKNHFCSHSCSCTHQNRNKKTGTTTSKLETFIANRIRQTYPSLTVIQNDRTTVGHELDIFIPSLRVAIEVNGIMHYEPIFGDDKFNRIQFGDQQKMLLCNNMDIELIVVPNMKTFSKKYSEKVWEELHGVLDKCIITRG